MCPSGCRSSQWAEPNGPERQGNLASDGNDEKSIVMLPESNLQGGKSRRDREKQGQRNNKRRQETGARERVITHARRPGIGFVFMLRWLHINLCKWRLWLNFHRASEQETTGLLPEKVSKKRVKERERERECSMKSAERKFSPFCL